MATMKALVHSTFFFCLLIAYVTGSNTEKNIKSCAPDCMSCYMCSTETDEDCGDPFTATELNTCSGIFCYKHTTQKEDKSISIQRGCTDNDLFKTCGKDDNDGIETEKCYCQTEGRCNFGNKIMMNIYVIILLILVQCFIM